MQTKVLSLFLIISNSLFAQLPSGDRIIAYQIDLAQNNSYDSAFKYAQEACMESVHLAFSWDSMEATPTLIGGPAFNLLSAVNIYYPFYGVKVELQIPVINTVVKAVPTDLKSVSFNSTVMINRFKILMDSVFIKIPNVALAALNIGNESDAYFGTNATAYSEFKIFLDSITPYIKQKYFNLHGSILKVGTTFTGNGLTDPNTKNLCKSVNQGRDIIALTYYPIALNFQVKNPNVISSEFGQLVAEYPNPAQPLYVVECGYPSSTDCGSSLLLQSQFIQKVFEAWDTYYNNIKYISFFKTTDWSQSTVDTLAVFYGLPNDIAFKEFLRTLGLRTYTGNGANKPAYDTLLCQLAIRGFCSTSCTTTDIDNPSPNRIETKLSPNPFKEKTTVEILNEKNMNYKLIICDVFGRELKQYEITNDKIEISKNDLSSGMYIYKVEDKNQNISFGKMIIE